MFIFYSNWRDLVKNNEINLVIVATPNNLIYEISLECIKANKHLLIEKPAGGQFKGDFKFN